MADNPMCVCGHSHSAHEPNWQVDHKDWSCHVCDCQKIKHLPDCGCTVCKALEATKRARQISAQKRWVIRCPVHNVGLIQGEETMYCVTCLNEAG